MPQTMRGEQQKNQGARAQNSSNTSAAPPGEVGEALHHVDQPVKAARRLDDSGPPAQEQRLLEGSGPDRRR